MTGFGFIKTLTVAAMIGAGSLTLAACGEDDPMEEAAKDAKEAAEEMKDAAEDLTN